MHSKLYRTCCRGHYNERYSHNPSLLQITPSSFRVTISIARNVHSLRYNPALKASNEGNRIRRSITKRNDLHQVKCVEKYPYVLWLTNYSVLAVQVVSAIESTCFCTDRVARAQFTCHKMSN